MRKTTGSKRVLVIGLDGYEASIGNDLMAQGELENFRVLKEGSARFLLDHGMDKYTGLAGEHFSSGQSPKTSGRWSPVHFDPQSYRVSQRGTALDPFVAHLSAHSVVFDPTYFDLEKAPQTNGIVAWGAHDPGTPPISKPAELGSEIVKRFGAYKAADCIYGFTWPSVDKTITAGSKLTQAVDQRAQIAKWLFTERLSNWNLAILVVSEVHSVLEPMWHGLDPTHPLYRFPSAQPAAAAVKQVYKAVDRLIGTLMTSLPDATIVTFAMHGMGPNEADVPSMLLLPEFLYRLEFNDTFFTPPPEWSSAPGEVVRLQEDQEWEKVVRKMINHKVSGPQSPRSRLWRFLSPWRKKPMAKSAQSQRQSQDGILELSLDWMPLTRYQPFWLKMKAFALPAYADGRIRINLVGREKHGVVKLGDYDDCCQKIETLLKQCRDLRTGEPVIQIVDRTGGNHPNALGPTEADLVVRWRGTPTGLRHPQAGTIGPAPYRRTGGHTGTYGLAYLFGTNLLSGDYGIGSSYDVVPTLFELLNEPIPAHIAGKSLLPKIDRPHL